METINKTIRIIPSLLIKDKRLVKGKFFKNHKDVGSPKGISKAFDSQNADEIFVCDLNSYLDKKKSPDFKTLKDISESTMTPITFGGGINSVEKAIEAFKNGADKIFLNSSLFGDPSLIKKIAKIYGSQSVMGGINITKINGKYKVYEESADPIEWFKLIQNKGVGEIKITHVDREGSGEGIDFSLFSMFKNIAQVPLIYEGGIGTLKHFETASEHGVNSIGLGTMIFFSDYNIVKIKQHIHNAGYKVRLR